MEGLIPFVYRVIVQYKNGSQEGPLSVWFSAESPSGSYRRLLGDSGRFQANALQLLYSDHCGGPSKISSSTSPRRDHSPKNQLNVASE
ncbi:hypothetical protein SAY87_014826 [Trapa incisa]|uniref:Legume-specific protein n=1 Tax=Trapa incisa TaxID=236973 RepID=A0AAN7JLF5_9MYRT|nr:hypothetical protein SAY87_014826 [Trapa incisa]